MTERDWRKELRNYLKGYRICQSQAKDIEDIIRRGGVADCTMEDLVATKDEFSRQCANIQIIIGCTSGLERKVLTAIYILGKKPDCIAREMGYSSGHISNIEGQAIKHICRIEAVKKLIQT